MENVQTGRNEEIEELLVSRSLSMWYVSFRDQFLGLRRTFHLHKNFGLLLLLFFFRCNCNLVFAQTHDVFALLVLSLS